MQAARNDPLLNSVLLGTYRIDRLLGRGGMGSVYAATHVHLQTTCAVKVLLHEFTDRQEPLKRFQREAQITSQLGHPNIVRVTDFNFTPDGAPFMVMELLGGQTLHKRLAERGRMTLPELVLLFGPLCDAIGLAHEKGVVHRDLKPENIFLPEGAGLDAAKILDFGISKIRDGNTKLTQADMSMGTQSYMAPEIVCGAAADADVRSDVFSLGAILFEVLTGKMAFDGPNAMAVMYKLIYQPPPSARAVVPEIPEEIEAVLQRAMARKPEERIQSAPELFSELATAAGPYLPPPEEMQLQVSTPYRFTTAAMKAVRGATGVHAAVVALTGTGPHAALAGARPPTGPQAVGGPVTGPQAVGGRVTGPQAVGGRVTGPQAVGGAVTGPQAVGGAVTGPQPAGGVDPLAHGPAPIDDLPDERAERTGRKGGTLIMIVIAGLVLVTGAGLFVLRQRLVGAPAATPADPGKGGQAPATPAATPAPTTPAATPAAAGGAAPPPAPAAQTPPPPAEDKAAAKEEHGATGKHHRGTAARDEREGEEGDGGKKKRRRGQKALPRLGLPQPDEE